MFTVGVRVPSNPAASQFGLPLGSATIGGRKKKSGFPLWFPSEIDLEGGGGAEVVVGFVASSP
jgi:hypothetical protein